jgi:hypothetical protein
VHLNGAAAGEAAGKVPEVLNALARYMEQEAETRSQIKSALMYPSLVVVALVFTILGLGAWAVTLVSPAGLRRALPFILLAVLVYTLARKDVPGFKARIEFEMLAESAPRAGFFDASQLEAVQRLDSPPMAPARNIGSVCPFAAMLDHSATLVRKVWYGVDGGRNPTTGRA